MNIHLISIVEGAFEKAAIAVSQLPQIKPAFKYDNPEKIVDYLKTAQTTFYTFFLNIAFLKPDIEYCSNVFYLEVRLDDSLENPALDTARKELGALKLKNPEERYNIVPIHIGNVKPEVLQLTTGIAAINKGKSLAIITAKEITVEKKVIDPMRDSLHYLSELSENYNGTIQEFMDKHKLTSTQFNKDCKEYFQNTFNQFSTKMNLCSAIFDLLFTSQSLKQIAVKNKFGNYVNMYKAFKKNNTPLSDIPRLALDH